MATIAIVIATFNGSGTLDACLRSIKEQSQSPEVVVMDGVSKDGTQEILKRWEADLNYWESSPDKGVYDAWNKALAHVTADWVWFMGCDDALKDSRVIERLSAALDDLPPDVGLFSTKVSMVARDGAVTTTLGASWEKVRRAMRYKMSIPHTGMLARRSLFDAVGQFDTNYRIAGDYDWTLRALDRSSMSFLDEVTVLAGEDGLSGATRTQVLTVREFGRICEARGVPKPIAWHWLYVKARAKDWLARKAGVGLQLNVVNLYRIFTLRSPRNLAR